MHCYVDANMENEHSREVRMNVYRLIRSFSCRTHLFAVAVVAVVVVVVCLGREEF